MMKDDRAAIDEITHQFFDLFTNTDNRRPKVRNIKNLFLSNGILINNTTEEPAIYDLESFIQPREEILTNGTLTNFVERETAHRTDIFGKIAQRNCDYEKSGELEGQPFTGKGKKLIQFVKLNNRWFLSSVVWYDLE